MIDITESIGIPLAAARRKSLRGKPGSGGLAGKGFRSPAREGGGIIIGIYIGLLTALDHLPA